MDQTESRIEERLTGLDTRLNRLEKEKEEGNEETSTRRAPSRPDHVTGNRETGPRDVPFTSRMTAVLGGVPEETLTKTLSWHTRVRF